MLPHTARAGDVSFEITIPTIPYTPVIEKVTNKDAVVGKASFKVYAEISGQEQMEVCCDPSGNGGSGPDAVCSHECEPNCDFSECSMTDFYGIPDPRVSPNPTCIPNSVDTSGGAASGICGGKSGNPKVFYYYNGDPTTGDSVDMVYDPELSKFVADVPIGDYGDGDIVFYYISAADNMGNVVSQVPDPETVPCTTLDAWSSEYSTPAIDNCSAMNVYTGVDSSGNCGVMVDGTPACSGTYTQNDPINDTCDSARKHDPSSPMVDIIGISAGAGKGYQGLEGKTVVCAKIGLGAPPPDPGASEGAMEAYVMVFFNPDIADPTPNDVHMTNAFAMTYVPEVASAEPNLVRVLWDGDCVTDPNTADPLSCKIMSGGGSEERIKIGASGPNLTFISQNVLPDGRTILGDKQNSTRAIIASGAINLSGDVPFWLTDTSAGLSVVKSVQYAPIGPQPPVIPIPPLSRANRLQMARRLILR